MACQPRSQGSAMQEERDENMFLGLSRIVSDRSNSCSNVQNLMTGFAVDNWRMIIRY